MKQFSEKQTDNFNRKLTGFLVVIVGIILIFAIALLAKVGDLTLLNRKLNSDKESSSDMVTVKGTPTCLTLKSKSTSSNKRCEVGIKADDGKFYAISNSGNSLNLYSEIGSSGFEVSGEFIKAGEEEKYDIVGTIVAK